MKKTVLVELESPDYQGVIVEYGPTEWFWQLQTKRGTPCASGIFGSEAEAMGAFKGVVRCKRLDS